MLNSKTHHKLDYLVGTGTVYWLPHPYKINKKNIHLNKGSVNELASKF